MVVINSGGGIGSEKHVKLQSFIERWSLNSADLVVEHFKAEKYFQVLTYIYRDTQCDEYYLVSSRVNYNDYLDYLDWKDGKKQLEEGESEISYEHDVKTFYLPLEALKVIAGDAITWLQEKVNQLQQPDDDWDPLEEAMRHDSE